MAAVSFAGAEAVTPSSTKGGSCYSTGSIYNLLSSHSASRRVNVRLQLDIQAELSSTLLSLRGGGEAEYEGDETEDALVGSARTLIKSVLGVSGPVLGTPVKLFVKILELLLGVKLLPQPMLKRKAKKKSDASLSRSKKDTTKSTSKRKVKKAKSVAKTETIASTKSTLQAKKKSPSKQKKKKKKSAASDAAMMHLKTKLSPANPNYRIQRELRVFIEDPPEGLRVRVGKNLRVWIVDMKGVGIYKSEKFQIRVKFPSSYPTMPPSVYFLPPHIPTHEHVYTNGDICLSLLGKDWRPTMTAQSIVLSIQSILGSAQSKSLPMDNVKQAQNKPGEYQKDWVYHDDCKLSSQLGSDMFSSVCPSSFAVC